MKQLRRVLAFLLTVCLFFSLFAGFADTVRAAADVKLNTIYADGKLTLSWNLPGTKSVQLKYYAPNNDDSASLVNVAASADPGIVTMTSTSVTGLKNDYIYSFEVEMYNAPGGAAGGGLLIGRGTVFFLPQASFYSQVVEQQPGEITGGGSESGVMPALKLTWKMAKIFDGASFVYVHRTFSTLSPLVRRLNYIVTVADDAQRSNVHIDYDEALSGADPVYKASVSGDNTRVSSVHFDSSSGMLTLYLLGRKDDEAYLPKISEVLSNVYSTSTDPEQNGDKVLPDAIQNNGFNNYVLPHADILPGTVYSLRLNSNFTDSTGGYIDAVSFGYNGFPLLGAFDYAATPVRFALTKDSLDNVYVKIFKVNKGSLNMPRLYYEVQTNTVPSSQDSTWTLRKTLDDTYFTGEYAYTVISGMNPNNTYYYRIVVRTDGFNDRIESLKLPYALKNDLSKPPVPKGITVVKRKLVTKTGYEEKSTDVTLSWEKPANWEQIKANTNPDDDVVFHILLNINNTNLDIQPPPSLEAEGKKYGNFPVSYRKVAHVSARSPRLVENGNRLEYTLKGFELFQGEHLAPDNPIPAVPTFIQDNFNPHETDGAGNEYPSFLLPNKVYYIQMYTTLARHYATSDPAVMSDKSLTASMTTLSGTQREVPLPNNFKTVRNDIQSGVGNFIELQFDKVNIDWSSYTSSPSTTGNDNVYYDLYMSTRTEADSFVRIATTEHTDGDIAFDGITNAQSIFIKARVQKFTDNTNAYTHPVSGLIIDPYEVFGDKLLPNTTYYFVLKTRLVMENEAEPKVSVATAILPVTTPRGSIADPDDAAKKPLAPVDFAIARDISGNLLVNGQTVTFVWKKQENGVRYSLIATSEKVRPTAADSEYASDPTFVKFIEEFSGDDQNSTDGKLVLDPAINPLINNFTFNKTTGEYRFTVNRWLFPNNLYYFSLRAEIPAAGGKPEKRSVWVSIPVTTALIEAPTLLEPVNDCQIGFGWTDTNPNLKPEDFRVFLRTSNGGTYKQLTRSQYTVARNVSGININYYARVFNLKADTSFDVKVEKPVTTGTTVTYGTLMEKVGLRTRDDYHQIEVRWKGLPIDSTSEYEIAIKPADGVEYITLQPADLELYTELESGSSYPYYIEKTAQTAGTNYSIYYARIRSVEIALPNGTKERRILKGNTKYHVKVRAKKTNAANGMITWSKYIGPVDTRTEFHQGDYDNTDQDLKKKALFLDKIAKLEEKVFWFMNLDSGTEQKLLLKGDRLANAVESTPGNVYTLDLSAIQGKVEADIVYLPITVADTLKKQNKSLRIKTSGAEYTFRPRTIDTDTMDEVTAVRDAAGVRELFVRLTAAQVSYPDKYLPAGSRVSRVMEMRLEVVGSSKTYLQLKEQFREKLYNADTGLVKLKIDDIMSSTYGVDVSTPQKLDAYIETMVHEVEIALSDYVNDTVEGTGGTQGVVLKNESVRTLASPVGAKLLISGQPGMKALYSMPQGGTAWSRLTQDVAVSTNSLTFNMAKPGKYVVMQLQSTAKGLPDDHWAKAGIDRLLEKYDLTDVFVGINQSFNPESTVSVKEIILLSEKLLGREDTATGKDLRQKAGLLGISDMLNAANGSKDVLRQETAGILIRVYADKTGMNADTLKPSRNVHITDDAEIKDKYYTYTVMAVDLGMLRTDANGNFNPAAAVTRAEVVAAFSKLLELTGEIK